jgi:hypothetical protein
MCHHPYAPGPEDIPPPLTRLQLDAAYHHELYITWIAAGFAPAEALQLLRAVVAPHAH